MATPQRVAPRPPATPRAPAPPEKVTEKVTEKPAQKLAERLARKLGIPAPPIRTGPAAQRRTEARRTRGLWEEGQIWLDERRVDLDSADGERLIAHELVHAAQVRQVPGNPKAAEAEAWVLSAELVKGREVRPVVGLGGGEAAAEGIFDFVNLGSISPKLKMPETPAGVDMELLQSNTLMIDATRRAQRFQGKGGKVDPDKEQIFNDFRDKVSEGFGDLRYDEVFQELIQKIKTPERESVMARLRPRNAYKTIAGLWAGTLPTQRDKDVPSEKILETRQLQQSAYDYEASTWGRTIARAYAYRLVAADAKLHPPPDAVTIPGDPIPEMVTPQLQPQKGKKKAKAMSLAEAMALVAQGLQLASQEQPVSPMGPSATFEALMALGDQPFDDTRKQIGLLNQSRMGEHGIGERLLDGVQSLGIGSVTYTYEMGKQYLDTRFVDLAGSYLDTKFDRISWVGGRANILKGKYVVGPLYTIGKALLSGQSMTGFAYNSEGLETIGKSGSRFWNRLKALASGEVDFCSMSFAFLADGIEVLRDVVDWFAGLLGNLSALSFALGVFLWLMAGLTSWLFPPASIAFSLAASAMFGLGELLGLLNTLLSLGSLIVFGPLLVLLRFLSTLIIPHQLYQEEAILFQEGVNNYATKAAAFRGDRLATKRRKQLAHERYPNEVEPPENGTPPKKGWKQRVWEELKVNNLKEARKSLGDTWGDIKKFKKDGEGWATYRLVEETRWKDMEAKAARAKAEKQDLKIRTLKVEIETLEAEQVKATRQAGQNRRQNRALIAAKKEELARRDQQIATMERRADSHATMKELYRARQEVQKQIDDLESGGMQNYEKKIAEKKQAWSQMTAETMALRVQAMDIDTNIAKAWNSLNPATRQSIWAYALTNSSSLNITGGMGSAWKDWLDPEMVLNWITWRKKTEEEQEKFKVKESTGVPSAEKQRIRMEFQAPAQGDGVDELSTAMAAAYYHRARATGSFAAGGAEHEEAIQYWAYEQYYASKVVSGAQLLTEGVRMQSAVVVSERRIREGKQKADDRLLKTQNAPKKGPTVPTDQPEDAKLGEAEEYMDDYESAGNNGEAPGWLVRSLMEAHLGGHALLTAQAQSQATSVDESLQATNTNRSTLDSLNLGIAEDLRWNMETMEDIRSEKQAAVERRDANIANCDTEAMITLNRFQEMKEWSKNVEESHKAPPILYFLGDWAPV